MTALSAAGGKTILGELLGNLAGPFAMAGDARIAISSVEYDSRRVRTGSLFVAVEGFSSDGHGFYRRGRGGRSLRRDSC